MWLKAGAADFVRCVVLYRRLMRGIPQPELRRQYRRRLRRLLQVRPDPTVVFILLLKCAMHYHLYTLAKEMAAGKTAVLNPF